MAKNKIVRLLLVWLCIGVHFAAPSQPTRRDYARKIADRAIGYSKMGIVEATNSNDGRPYELFMKPYGYPKGTFWCMLFVMRSHFDVGLVPLVNNPPWSGSWYIKKRVIWLYGAPVDNQMPMAGDVCLFKMKSKRINHGGIVVEWNPSPSEKDFISTEGNTSAPVSYFVNKGIKPNSKGFYPRVDGVFTKARPKSSTIIVRVELYKI